MARTNIIANSWGVSFFGKRDKIVIDRIQHSESFESPSRTIDNLGQIALLFSRFDKGYINNVYKDLEKAYSITSTGTFITTDAKLLALTNFFEVQIMLRTEKKVESDQMICHLWIKDVDEPIFSTYLDEIENSHTYSNFYSGGHTWWAGDQTIKGVRKLLLPKSMKILSNLCISIESLPRQYMKKEVDEFISDEEIYFI